VQFGCVTREFSRAISPQNGWRRRSEFFGPALPAFFLRSLGSTVARKFS